VRILVLGSGAREHALAWRLARDGASIRIAPGNGGTPAVAETVEGLDIGDPAGVARHAARERYDLVVVGPEAPLAAGVADALTGASVPTFGPTAAAARLESSKAFAKEQLRRAEVPTASSALFTDPDAAIAALRSWEPERPPVVKADWLAAGKGVVVAESTEEAEAAVRALLGAAPPGGKVLLEERLAGREVSVFALVSGQAVVPLGAACDYKRLQDGDLGPNTGGMGAYAPVSWFGSAEVEATVASIFEPIAWRMSRDGTPYRGVLYAGLMLTDEGPMVLEFNVRFGDPEAQVLLPLLDGELAAALLGVALGDRGAMEGSLGTLPGAAVGVVIAAAGYPEAPEGGAALEGAEPSGPDDGGPLLRFHAGTRRAAADYEAAGGRVATIVGLGADLSAARAEAYRGVNGSTLAGGQHRTDIAAREVPS